MKEPISCLNDMGLLDAPVLTELVQDGGLSVKNLNGFILAAIVQSNNSVLDTLSLKNSTSFLARVLYFSMLLILKQNLLVNSSPFYPSLICLMISIQLVGNLLNYINSLL